MEDIHILSPSSILSTKIKVYLKNSKVFEKVGLQIAKITDMRAEEICKLKCKDVNFKETSATVKVIDGKGKRNREIPITKQEDVNYLKTLITPAEGTNNRICAIE